MQLFDAEGTFPLIDPRQRVLGRAIAERPPQMTGLPDETAIRSYLLEKSDLVRLDS